jgi:hypothetical protein
MDRYPALIQQPDSPVEAKISSVARDVVRFGGLKRRKSRARKWKFAQAFQADLGGPVLERKIFRFALAPNQWFPSRIPHPREGRFAIVTDVGSGMRWTLWLCVDERSLKRTAKSCGPGAPTLALSFSREQFRWK